MKLLTDFLPIALFFITFKLAGIYVATGVAIAATLLQIGWLYFRNGKVEAMQWVSLVIIVLFGGNRDTCGHINTGQLEGDEKQGDG